MQIDPIGIIRKASIAESRIDLHPEHTIRMAGLTAGATVDILYWMHDLSDEQRGRVAVHPRGDKAKPKKGVFALRSPMRPNPIGVTTVGVVAVDRHGLTVSGLDAHEGSPVLDIKAAKVNRDLEHVITLWGHIHHVIIAEWVHYQGEENVENLLRKPLQEAGREAGKDLKADNARDIGHSIMAIEKMWGITGEITQEDTDCFVRRVDRCPWSYFCPLGCEVFVWWMEGFVDAANPDYSYSLDAAIPRGDGACVWSLRAKE